MTDSHQPDPVDAVARQLVGALLCGLVLVLPLRTALGATGGGAVFLSVLGAVLLTLLAGRLLGVAGVPYAVETSLAAMGLFGVAAVIALTVVGLLGDPGDAAEVSLLAGLPAAAAAAIGAAALQSRSRDAGPALAAAAVGLLVALIASAPVGGLLAEARDDASDIRAFTEVGLAPYLPDITGLDSELSGRIDIRPEGGGPREVTGYRLTYRQPSPPGSEWDAAYIDVGLTLADGAACEESLGSITCIEGDGYLVRERDGVPEAVIADHSDIRLVATFREGDGELPEPGEVGRALADAETAEWDDVVGLDD